MIVRPTGYSEDGLAGALTCTGPLAALKRPRLPGVRRALDPANATLVGGAQRVKPDA
jgi:hypothetical protein